MDGKKVADAWPELVDDWLNHEFSWFWPVEMTQEAADNLVGQEPKFNVEGTPAGSLIITKVEKRKGGVDITCKRKRAVE